MFKGTTVLICWEHNNLALMAEELQEQLKKMDFKVNGTPKKWEWPGSHVFGRTWVFSFKPKEKNCDFHDFAQRLMFDDAKQDKK